MTPEDRISVHKFHQLVDRCKNKDEILDLCERALRTYRPLQQKASTLDVTYNYPQSRTFKVKALQSVDRYRLTTDAPAYERVITEQIGSRLGAEALRNKLIKFETHENDMYNTKTFVGTLEVIIP